jgi:hypothetical protein
MKSVSEQEWKAKAAGLAEWRKNRTSAPNLDLYRKIVSMVHVGDMVLDVGCGQCHLLKVLPEHEWQLTSKFQSKHYYGIDPFPVYDYIPNVEAEYLVNWIQPRHTVFMLSALDNVKNLEESLKGLKHVALENIVILTGIGIPPDINHTVQIDRKDLTDVLGEPFQEVEMLPKVWLFEWKL